MDNWFMYVKVSHNDVQSPVRMVNANLWYALKVLTEVCRLVIQCNRIQIA